MLSIARLHPSDWNTAYWAGMSDRQPLAHTVFVKAMQAGKELTLNSVFSNGFVNVLILRITINLFLLFHGNKRLKTNRASMPMNPILLLEQ